ncbi:V-type proton ATPase subunit e [Aphomia sociella]
MTDNIDYHKNKGNNNKIPLSSSLKGEKGSPTPIYVITMVFALIFIIGPILVRKGPNRGIIRCSIMLTAFSMWIFWVTIYIAQMNPLMGPRLDNTTLAWIAHAWGKSVKSATLLSEKAEAETDQELSSWEL